MSFLQIVVVIVFAATAVMFFMVNVDIFNTIRREAKSLRWSQKVIIAVGLLSGLTNVYTMMVDWLTKFLRN